jgi:hypothetical protein
MITVHSQIGRMMVRSKPEHILDLSLSEPHVPEPNLQLRSPEEDLDQFFHTTRRDVLHMLLQQFCNMRQISRVHSILMR